MRTEVAPQQQALASVPFRVGKALADFQRRLIKMFPDDVKKLVLYGSYADGSWDQESDVDLLVVTRWQEDTADDGAYLAWFGDGRWSSVIDLAASLLVEYGVYISPFVVGEARYARSNEALIANIRREGLTLWQN